MNLFIILNLFFFAILAAVKPRLGLLFILLALPTYLIRFNFFFIPTTLLEGMILIAFLFWLIESFPRIYKSLTHKFAKRQKYPFRWEIIAILLLSYMAVCVSNFNLAALGSWRAYFFEPIILFILIINYFPNKDDWQKLIWSLSLSAMFISIVAWWQEFTGLFIFNPFWADISTRRVVSVFGYPNAIGLYLAPIILLSTGLLFQKLKDKKNFHKTLKIISLIIIILVSLVAIYFARSEGALIATLASLGIFALIYNRYTRITAISLAVLGLIFILLQSSALGYIKEKVLLHDKSGQIRQAQWQETTNMLKNNTTWITGSGLSNYQAVIKPYHHDGIFIKDYNDPDWLRKTLFNEEFRKNAWQPLEIYMYPHNIVLNFWTELGLLGLIAFIWLFIKLFIRAVQVFKNNKKYRALSAAIIGVLSTMIIHGIVDVPYFKNDLSALFWIIVAILSLSIIQTRKILEERKK